MKTTWLFAFVIVSISAVQIGCGSSDSGSGGSAGAAGSSAGSGGNSAGSTASDFPAIALDADIRTLSDADKAKVCDWVNSTLGGYGLETTCASGNSVSNASSQAVCVATFFNVPCKVTPAQVKACVLTEAPSHACNSDNAACDPVYCN